VLLLGANAVYIAALLAFNAALVLALTAQEQGDGSAAARWSLNNVAAVLLFWGAGVAVILIGPPAQRAAEQEGMSQDGLGPPGCHAGVFGCFGSVSVGAGAAVAAWALTGSGHAAAIIGALALIAAWVWSWLSGPVADD
jgi:hypothetical protein